MYHKCCIINCENNKDYKDKKFSLCLFPKAIELRNKWLNLFQIIMVRLLNQQNEYVKDNFILMINKYLTHVSRMKLLMKR